MPVLVLVPDSSVIPGTGSGTGTGLRGWAPASSPGLVEKLREIRVETRAVDLTDPKLAEKKDVTPGRYVALCVEDTGAGIDPKVLARVFEPFVTTKPKAEGAGLGLAMVHGIVRQSAGAVSVCSELEHGTKFEMLFPRVEPPRERADPPTAGHRQLDGTETLLVVDDEAAIRNAVRRSLARRGYTQYSSLRCSDRAGQVVRGVGAKRRRAPRHVEHWQPRIGRPGQARRRA